MTKYIPSISSKLDATEDGSSGSVPTSRTINTTSPLTGGGDLSADRTIGITLADSTHSGYLSFTDWNTFNNNPNLSWKLNGSTVGSEKSFGTIDNFSIPIITNNTTVGKVFNTGELTWGTSTFNASTLITIKGTGNDDTTYSQFWKDSSDLTTAWIRDDGVVNANRYFYIGGVPTLTQKTSNSNIYIGNQDNPLVVNNGASNMAMGYDALGSNLTGMSNVSIGVISFISATAANDSVVIGRSAGLNALTGNAKIFIGAYSGQADSTGSKITLLGTYSDVEANNLSEGIAIGTGALLRANNQFVVGGNTCQINEVYIGGNGLGGAGSYPNGYSSVFIQNSIPNPTVADQDLSSVSIKLRCTPSTGAGISGNIICTYSPPIASGTTIQTSLNALYLEGTSGNIGLWGNSFADGKQVMFYNNAGVNPTTNPTNGFLQYSNTGKPTFRTSSGNVISLYSYNSGSAYSLSGASTLRSLSVGVSTLTDTQNILATLINDLKLGGLIV